MIEEFCPLCGLLKPLVKSHLIPSWAYKSLKSENDKYTAPILIDTDSGSALLTDNEFKRHSLCGECDNIRLGQVENDVSGYFKSDNWPNEFLTPHPRFSSASIVDQCVDLEKVRYFAVSVIWRSSIMKAGIKLGRYENQIRNYLMGRSILPEEVVFSMTQIQSTNNDPAFVKMFTLPTSSKHGLVWMHGFHFLGFSFKLFISKSLPEYAKTLQLMYEQRVILSIPFEESRDMKYVTNMVLDASPKGKLRKNNLSG